MTCPNCGTTVQPHDLFCMSCGHALTPADPTRHLDTPVEAAAAYGAGTADHGYGAPPIAEPARQEQPPQSPAYARPLQSPPYASPPAGRSRDGQAWASGSSFPTANPYTSTPNTVSSGTILNGRPVGGRRGGGMFQGLGAAIIALGVLLGKFGGVLAGLGLWKILGFYWLFGWLFRGGHSWVALIIVLLIVSAIWRARTA